MKKSILFPVLLFAALTLPAQQIPGIIPLPNQVKVGLGSVRFENKVTIFYDDEAYRKSALLLEQELIDDGCTYQYIGRGNASINLLTASPYDSLTGREGYRLLVSGDKVTITSNTPAGCFYGINTLMQVMKADKGKLEVPVISVTDYPAFGWRGTMLDVARHMTPLAYIKKHIDWMAAYKLNVLHLHLTDDQGWRIEIKKYPKLAEKAAWRKETIIGWQPGQKETDWKFDGRRYGGYYTQDQLRDLVAYAASRQITIVPEIEMPGHSLALLSAYPELACRTGNFQAATYWGVFDDIILPTQEAINVMKGILDEVCDIFPSQFIHIGGDEAPKKLWKDHEYIKALMEKEKIDDVEKVQGWFNRKIEEHLAKKGRRLIGWDEILDGGISGSAAVMSWRGNQGGTRAASQGNDVVMSPGSAGMYWDHAQGPVEFEPEGIGRREGNAPWNKVYAYYPVPADLQGDKYGHILGMQANLWSEYIQIPEAFEYLTFPRILALSEAAWTLPGNKDWHGFLKRCPTHFLHFEEAGLNFRIPEPVVIREQKMKRSSAFQFYTPMPGSLIRYTLDGTIPKEESAIYNGTDLSVKNRILRKYGLHAAVFTQEGKQSAPLKIKCP